MWGCASREYEIYEACNIATAILGDAITIARDSANKVLDGRYDGKYTVEFAHAIDYPHSLIIGISMNEVDVE